MDTPVFDKPRPCPTHWSLDAYVAWAEGDALSPDTNISLPLADARTHVAIDPARFSAADGQLFRTEALDFGVQRNPADSQHGDTRDDCDWVMLGRGPAALPAGLVVFGGERRLSYLAPNANASLHLPQALEHGVANATGLAVTLASPALFRAGWKPGWLDEQMEGDFPSQPHLRVKLIAAKVDRWHAVSGWDLHLRKPKPTRRAVAAGATYWFRILSGRPDPAALWLSPISDSAQDRNDGFGLALVRPWQFTE
jgi:CRISPR-associated protein Cmr3